MDMSDAQRFAAKRWRRRNSNFRDTFELDLTQSPPAFDLVEYPLPVGTVRLGNPDPDEEQAHAVRHVHVFDPALVEYLS